MLLYPISVSGGYCSNSVSRDSVNYSHADDVAVLQSQTVFGVNLRASQCVSQDSPHLPRIQLAQSQNTFRLPTARFDSSN